MMEVEVTRGAIRHCHHQQINTQLYTRRMPFQLCGSTIQPETILDNSNRVPHEARLYTRDNTVFSALLSSDGVNLTLSTRRLRCNAAGVTDDDRTPR